MHKEVAPLVGAWIEIACFSRCRIAFFVAPLVGAWIEIQIFFIIQPFISVAPLVGAWIEIWHKSRHKVRWKWSLLSWERGLKLKNLNTNDCVIWSLLSWERGLKFCKVSGCACTCRRSSRGSVN